MKPFKKPEPKEIKKGVLKFIKELPEEMFHTLLIDPITTDTATHLRSIKNINEPPITVGYKIEFTG
jgi:hypothetical protein